MTDETDDTTEEIISGPYCVHWGDPSDCDEPCARPGCGHKCCDHFWDDQCKVEGCECQKYVKED